MACEMGALPAIEGAAGLGSTIRFQNPQFRSPDDGGRRMINQGSARSAGPASVQRTEIISVPRLGVGSRHGPSRPRRPNRASRELARRRTSARSTRPTSPVAGRSASRPRTLKITRAASSIGKRARHLDGRVRTDDRRSRAAGALVGWSGGAAGRFSWITGRGFRHCRSGAHVRVRKLPLCDAWGFPEIWVNVPDVGSPSRPKSRWPGLPIHVLEAGRLMRAESSRAFPGWTAEEIERALNEDGMSAGTAAISPELPTRPVVDSSVAVWLQSLPWFGLP